MAGDSAAPGPADPATPWRPGDPDLDILANLARGHTVEAVARWRGVSERTVRRRLRHVADGLGVGSTIEAVVLAVRRGLI